MEGLDIVEQRAIAIIALIAVLGFSFLTFELNKRNIEEENNWLRLRELREQERLANTTEGANQARVLRSGRPKVFRYLDTSMVDSYFDQISDGLTLSQATREDSRSSGSGIGASLQGIGLNFKREKSDREPGTFSGVDSADWKYKVIEDDMVRTRVLRFGLESFDTKVEERGIESMQLLSVMALVRTHRKSS